MSSNLLKRIIVIAVFIPIVLTGVYIGGWALAGGLAFFGAAGAREMYELAERGSVRPLHAIGITGAALIPLATFAAARNALGVRPIWLLMALAVWVMVVLAVALRKRKPTDRPLTSVSVTVFAALFTGGMPAFLLLLRHPHAPVTPWAGTWLAFLPLVVVWICDTFAMGGGSLVGGRRLAPVISPNKTWAGAVAGGVGGVMTAEVYGRTVLDRVGIGMTFWQLAAFGLIVSTAGQFGDLTESLFKREVGVKDSGNFFPGHGGVLDRFDSLYWAIPMGAILLSAFGTI